MHPTPTPSTLLDPPHPPDFSCPSPDSKSSSNAWYTRGKPSFQFPARISGEAASKPNTLATDRRTAHGSRGRGELHNTAPGSKDPNHRTNFPLHPYLGGCLVSRVSYLISHACCLRLLLMFVVDVPQAKSFFVTTFGTKQPPHRFFFLLEMGSQGENTSYTYLNTNSYFSSRRLRRQMTHEAHISVKLEFSIEQ